MIRLNLEIADPTRSDGPKLLALAALFTQLAQGTGAEQTRDALDKAVSGARPAAMPQAMAAPYAGQVVGAGALDPADNPAAGMPSPVEAFGTTMGNAAAGSVSASFPSPASTGADSTSASPESENGGHSAPAASLPDPAVAFGGNSAPNVPAPGVPSMTPSGTPSAPNSGAQTAGASTLASGGVDLDAEGIPWDASIHASTKAKLVNGNWKLKRGVGETYVLERKAVLRAALAAGNAAPGAGAPATPPANVPVPPPAGAGAPVPPPPGSVGNVPAATGTPQASQQTTPGAAGSSPVTLAQVLPRVTAAMAAGLLTPDSSAAIVREISEGKIDNVAMLAVAPALIPALVARLDALGIPA
jgi:hypothetical protein